MSGLGGQISLVKTQVKKLRAPVRSGFGSFGTNVFRKAEPFPVGLGNKDPHHQNDTFMLRRSVRRQPLSCYAKPSSSPPEAKKPNFFIGIQHGALLAIGGLVHYGFSRSMLGIMFGVSPGALLFFSSIHDLNTWKKGNSSVKAMLGTAAYVSVLYAMEMWFLLKGGPTESGYVAVLSAIVIFVYMCRTLHAVWKERREQPVDLEKKE